MAVFLVRHAQAGHRGFGHGDRERSLSASGEAQAAALAGVLKGTMVTRLLSSPYLRCVQTLEPLAATLGVTVETTPLLAEGMPFEPVLELLAGLPEGAVLCSHGDVIPDVVQALLRRGLHIHGEPRWSKGSVWTLDRTNNEWTDGRSFVL
jgi:8-oxo-dGTP diphosphatase